MTLILVRHYDTDDEEYYCVECCAKTGAVMPIEHNFIQPMLENVVQHVFDDFHKTREITIKQIDDMDSIILIIKERKLMP